MSLKMKELPASERPYEKLLLYGEKKLSNAELLAIIIKTGTKEETSLDIANRVLLLIDSIKDLNNLTIDELEKIKGIGKVKSIQIKAMCELAKRINEPINNTRKKVMSSGDVAELFIDEMKYEKREKLKILLLNTKNEIVKIINLKSGTNREIAVEPTEILKEVIKEDVEKFILIHNHPSGDPTPSAKDYEFTDRMIACAKLLGIKLLDHIIIGIDSYKSIMLREEKNNES